jgi:hypothetical protein
MYLKNLVGLRSSSPNKINVEWKQQAIESYLSLHLNRWISCNWVWDIQQGMQGAVEIDQTV